MASTKSTVAFNVVSLPFIRYIIRLSYRHASICTNFSFDFLKKFLRDQRWPTAHLFVVNISLSGEFTAPVRHMLPIHNITINSNNLFVNLTAFTSSTYFLLATTKAFVFFFILYNLPHNILSSSTYTES